jgi:hypothetical protein
MITTHFVDCARMSASEPTGRAAKQAIRFLRANAVFIAERTTWTNRARS